MANKLTIMQTVEGMLKLTEQGKPSTLIGIGPMSSNLLQATFELARDFDFPPMFIASRNQVDSDEFGAGYVNGWDQFRFAADIKAAADAVGYTGDYYLCRDHGGPWQRDEERNAHLPEDEAMDIARRSYQADLEAGFDLLMIDPTKDPFEIGKVIPLDTVLTRTVELIEWCENKRKELGLAPVGYEVGTEETNGGLTTTDKYQEFIERLKVELDARGLPMPTFIVGQTGTLVRMTDQVGTYDFENAVDLAKMAASYGVGLKEHNCDYLDDETMLVHQAAGVTASNVAPQFGTEETRALLRLAHLEQTMVEKGLIKAEDASDLRNVLLDHAIRTERWRKWMVGDDTKLTVEQIFADNEKALAILDIAGHYTFNEPEVKAEVAKNAANLATCHIDAQRYAVNCVKRSIQQFVEGYAMTGVTTRIKEVLGA